MSSIRGRWSFCVGRGERIDRRINIRIPKGRVVRWMVAGPKPGVSRGNLSSLNLIQQLSYYWGMPYLPRKIHLPGHNYLGRRRYFIGVCTEGRRPVFADRVLGHSVFKCLRECAARAGFLMHAVCVMPDHVHAVVEGSKEDCDQLTFVHGFKQRTGFEFRPRFGGPLWQKRFHDYPLRSCDAIEDVAAHVWMNPVRQGLCQRPEEEWQPHWGAPGG